VTCHRSFQQRVVANLFRKLKRGEHYETAQKELMDDLKANISHDKRRADNGPYSRHRVTLAILKSTLAGFDLPTHELQSVDGTKRSVTRRFAQKIAQNCALLNKNFGKINLVENVVL
jgi:hypothetical protein